MPTARNADVSIYYESRGSGEPIILIAGLGCPGFYWHDTLCDLLADGGLQVIRVDHRDVGRSSKLHHLPVPSLHDRILRYALRLPVDAPYSLRDMADDVVAVQRALGLFSSHVAGLSLGGAVAQTLAIEAPARVRSLTSVMSTTGAFRPHWTTLRGAATLFGPAPLSPSHGGEMWVRAHRIVGSRGWPRDEQTTRKLAVRSYEYELRTDGMRRHLAALIQSGDRTKALQRVTCPTLVIHGSCDTLIRPAAGVATHRAIPNSELVVVKGMGHDLPPATHPRIASAMLAHVQRTAGPTMASNNDAA